MRADTNKIGLVLSGGGAKGAYQAGVIRALAEAGIGVDTVAGASIGALNGAMVAAAPDLQTAAERLHQVWQKLPEIKPLQLGSVRVDKKRLLAYIALLSSASLPLNPLLMKSVMPVLQWLLGTAGISASMTPDAVFTDKPLQQMLDDFLDIRALQHSLPLYVSVFEQPDYLLGGLDLLKAEFLGIDNPPSRFEHIQSLPLEQQKETLMASAALPLLFKSRNDDDGVRLTDGGQGGWIKAQGNTPVTPLVEAGCNYIIVSHLDHGALWHRQDFPHVTFIEIRPNAKLDLGLQATLDFSAAKIAELEQCGYTDSMHVLQRIADSLGALYRKRAANDTMQESLAQLSEAEDALQRAMDNLLK
ncbi:NTE family protein [Neisseria sp. HSC-16F19]|nr:patatin-like phospholipase family protein [Neisseria sp. HSC-16F19]MCP2039893.1 NTE family protein [Neisseria sp. HSC-16F19]